MQIMGPDGVPMIAPPSGAGADLPQAGRPPAAETRAPRAPATLDGNGSTSVAAATVAHAIPVPVKAPSTTIDELEHEFQRKKKRELEHARMAGSNGDSEAPARRRTGEKVGRNDLCPCGSGKKFKKCHGAE